MQHYILDIHYSGEKKRLARQHRELEHKYRVEAVLAADLRNLGIPQHHVPPVITSFWEDSGLVLRCTWNVVPHLGNTDSVRAAVAQFLPSRTRRGTELRSYNNRLQAMNISKVQAEIRDEELGRPSGTPEAPPAAQAQSSGSTKRSRSPSFDNDAGPHGKRLREDGEAQRTTGDRSGCTVPGVNKSTEVPQFQPFAAATRPGVRAPQHSRGTNVLAPIENIPRAVAQAGPGQNQTTKPTSTAVRAIPTGAAAPGTGVAIKQEVTDDAQALVPTGTTHRQENAPPPYQEARANQDARNRHMPGPLDDLKDCLQRAVAAATAAEVKVVSLERDVVAHEHEMERVGACVQNRERLMWARENRLKAQLKAKVEAVKIAEGRLAAAQGQLEVERGLLEVERARHAEQNAMLEQQLGDTVGRRDHAERSAQALSRQLVRTQLDLQSEISDLRGHIEILTTQMWDDRARVELWMKHMRAEVPGPRAKLEAVGFYVGAGQAF